MSYERNLLSAIKIVPTKHQSYDSLTHCDGCVPPDLIGDPCELLPDRKTTYYDAATCRDIDLIREALVIQGRS